MSSTRRAGGRASGAPTHLGYLEALLHAELEEREHRQVQRRLRDAHLPRMTTLEKFDFSKNRTISAHQIHELDAVAIWRKPSRLSS